MKKISEKINTEIETKKSIGEIENSNCNIKKNRKTSFGPVEVLILLISTAIIFSITGIFLYTKFFEVQLLSKPSTENINSDLKEVSQVYEYILENYYGEVDKNDLIRKAIDGMLSGLDDANTTYIDESISNNFNILLNGSYEGVGIEIANDSNGNIVVVEVFEDTPASKAGLKNLDIIKSINGTSTQNMETSEVVQLIKQATNSNISIVVERDGEETGLELKREIITLDSVIFKIIQQDNKKIGYVYISIFASNTYEQFKEKLEELENNEIDSLIIDVRSNSGGHLSSATKILSLFLDSSKIIYQVENKNGIQKIYSEGTETKNYPMVVLVDEQSASASEILASALKEQYGATLVGKKTYGKGTVQELLTLTSGIQYKITTQHWLTSLGTWIDQNGIDVDYEVELSEEYMNNPTQENDNQLQKALSILK